MKLALLGKFQSENGMGLANIEIKKELEAFYEVSYSKETGLLRRLWELCGLVLCCDVLVICSSAFVNYPAVWLAELQKNTVLSAGGGRRQKNILTVASALEDSKCGYILHVAGQEASEGGMIRSHRNVVWHGNIPHEDFLTLMAASSLYVQNSIYETFGIAVVYDASQQCPFERRFFC